MRLDIPEGADFEDMPILFGFGRIHGRSATPINERYLSIHLFGWRYFLAWSKYGTSKTHFRHWLRRDRSRCI